MQAAELETYLHDHIPLTRAMEVSVLSSGVEEVVLGAPLAPNINHRDTVFGGSAASLATLAAWSLLFTRLRREGVASQLVIHRNTMEFGRPITEAFEARAVLDQPEAWATFIRTLSRRAKARITVRSVLEQGGEVVGTFSGDFVALRAVKT